MLIARRPEPRTRLSGLESASEDPSSEAYERNSTRSERSHLWHQCDQPHRDGSGCSCVADSSSAAATASLCQRQLPDWSSSSFVIDQSAVGQHAHPAHVVGHAAVSDAESRVTRLSVEFEWSRVVALSGEQRPTRSLSSLRQMIAAASRSLAAAHSDESAAETGQSICAQR
jgi:hypothetical protein